MVDSTHQGQAAARPNRLGQAAGGRIHTEKSVSSRGLIDPQDGALRSQAPAPDARNRPPQSSIETLNKYIQNLLGWAGTGRVQEGSAHFYSRCLERKKRG